MILFISLSLNLRKHNNPWIYHHKSSNLIKKFVILEAPSYTDISFLWTGTALTYTEHSTLRIHCPLTNTPLNRINIPHLKRTLFLFDNAMLVGTSSHVKYLSTYDNTYIRSYTVDNLLDIHAVQENDTFMCVSSKRVEFYDLRSSALLKYLNVRNCMAALNTLLFAVVINTNILKVLEMKCTAPKYTKRIQNMFKIKLTGDNKYVIVGTAKVIIFLEMESGEEVQKIYLENLVDFDVSECSRFVYVMSDEKVYVYEIGGKEKIVDVFVGEQGVIGVNPSYAQFVCARPDITFYCAE